MPIPIFGPPEDRIASAEWALMMAIFPLLLYDLKIAIDVHDVFWVVVQISAGSFDPSRRGRNGSCIVRARTSSVCYGFGLWYVGVEDVGCYRHRGREEAHVFVIGFSLIHRVMDGWKGGRCG